MKASPSSPVKCSGCGSFVFSAGPDGAPFCDSCGRLYAPAESQCPRCGTTYEPGDRQCLSCGAILTRDCPLCGNHNPLTAPHCVVCGQVLDASEAVFARLSTKTPDQLRKLRRTGAQIKLEEERASEARLAAMWAEEERLREEQVRARARREHQERVMVAVTIGVVAVAVSIVIIIVLISSRTPTPVL